VLAIRVFAVMSSAWERDPAGFLGRSCSEVGGDVEIVVESRLLSFQMSAPCALVVETLRRRFSIP